MCVLIIQQVCFILRGTWSLLALPENAGESWFSLPGQGKLGAQWALPLVTQEAGWSAPATAAHRSQGRVVMLSG